MFQALFQEINRGKLDNGSVILAVDRKEIDVSKAENNSELADIAG